MSFGVGSGESNWGAEALQEMLGRAAEGIGDVLPEPDGQWSRIAVYLNAELGRRVTVHPADEQRRAFLTEHAVRIAVTFPELEGVARRRSAIRPQSGASQTVLHIRPPGWRE
ncbi:hypothetical protein ACGFZP_37930 [Kitasatospora sp. NPDC048239]|uniref:hypothetical protein n=1 Tax=Kitasatospora sp. NPDC048239 TaxID=3364046 RepID=UPI0037240820